MMPPFMNGERPSITDLLGAEANGEEGCSRLTDRMQAFFAADGPMSDGEGFEYRPQQQEMAVAVAEALATSRPLMVEAGTGVGKSLAYLIPALLHAAKHNKKAIVSTHTINLQEQLILKDIPLAMDVLGLDLKAVLYKGRGNYLCPLRLQAAMSQTRELFSSSEDQELQAIWEWSQTTKDGSLSDLTFSPNPKVWAQVRSEPHVCTKRRCKDTPCYYQALRKRVDEAHVVVMNHTLFFTLLGAIDEMEDPNMEGFLFPNDFVVFDEAHTLENVAAKQLGLNLSYSNAAFDLHRLYNPKTRKGIFQSLRDPTGAQAVADLSEEMEFFFNEIENSCRFQGEHRVHRVRDAGLTEDTLASSIIGVEKLIGQRSDDLDDENKKLELEDLGRRLQDLRLNIRGFLDQEWNNHVYWVERIGQSANVTLNAAPLNIAERFRDIFFSSNKPVILTSATLGTGEKDLSYFSSRIGAEKVRAEQIGSPFNYMKQMRLYVAKTMPEPNDIDFEEALEKQIQHFVTQSSGRAFVLFTSYRLMQRIAGRMTPFFSGQGWPLLVQGSGKPRATLVEMFKKDIGSVLFGTDSFWTGVDVPGEALSNVIVTRLPFAVPDHPLVESRLEQIRERNGNPFMEYSVPEAVLKLRQGIGRLIRSEKDRGIAVILDNRVLTRRYGKIFLQALPQTRLVVVE
ncbi:MAG: ATP-dependent DNA helicase [Verrucomicrobiales bacterium]|nr:ATP-dependent DNA helicase [Verrucomicrobiales bacterium]